MGNSLQDQLLKAGLVNNQRLKQAKADKRKENRQTQGQPQAQADLRQRLQEQAAEKARRDRELNLKRQEEIRRREEENSIRQLIHAHRIPRQGGEIAFNFQDGGRLRRLYVTPEQQRSLVAGRMALVRQDEEVELVPRAIAENLLNHRASLVLVLNHPATEQAVAKAEEEDPYASYQVPDDLIW
ncbi:MAG: DUF2058 domain-containing protein [Chromatiaceae bacterium]|nr:DUF2058 domain-containing protein [Candidatus Thioaporhodococcus sediminis]